MFRTIVFMALLAPALLAQSEFELTRALKHGGSAFDTGGGVSIDAAGNMYYVAQFSGMIYLDSVGMADPVTSSGPASMLAKYDRNGNYLWGRAFQSSLNDVALLRVAVDAAGNIHVAGQFRGVMDADPGAGVHNITSSDVGATTSNALSLCVLKLDTNGGFIWARQFDSHEVGIRGLALGPAGTVHVCCVSMGSFDLDPGAGTVISASSALVNSRLIVLSSKGDYVWGVGHGGNGGISTIETVAVDAQGATIIGGSLMWALGSQVILSAGTVPNATISCSSIQPDGKILIGGSFTAVGGAARNYFARLNADGSLDAGFFAGSGADSIVRAVVLQPDGKILIGGNFSTIAGTARARIARLNNDGSLDAGFNPGSGVNGLVTSLALQSDGKVLLGGSFSTVNGQPRARVARLNSDGSLDGSFDPATGPDGAVNSMALQPDGKLVIAGTFTTVNSINRGRVARLNADGSLDTGFDPGSGADNTVNAVVRQTDGKFMLGGFFTDINGNARSRVARLNADGSVDTGFNPGAGADAGVNTVTVQQDGRIVLGGSFTTVAGVSRYGVARLNGDGSFDASLDPGAGTNGVGVVQSLALQPNGRIVVVGSFTSFAAQPLYRAVRLNQDGSVDATFSPGIAPTVANAIGTVDFYVLKHDAQGTISWVRQYGTVGLNDVATKGVALDAGGNVYAAGKFGNGNGNPMNFGDASGPVLISAQGQRDVFVVKLAPTGQNIWVKTMGGSGNNPQQTLALKDGAVIVGGQFTGTIDLDPGTGTAIRSASSGSAFIAKLTLAGDYLWGCNFGGTSASVLNTAADSRGRIMACGTFSGTADMDPTAAVQTMTSASGSTDAFVIMLQELYIEDATLPSVCAGTHTSAMFQARLGSGAGYAWSLASGALPPGINGIPGAGTPSIMASGTPTAAGSYAFTLRVTDSAGNTATREFTWVILAPVVIDPAQPASLVVGTAASFAFTATGGDGSALSWSVVSGALPAGLAGTVSGQASYTASGTPSAAGSFGFRLRAQDGSGNFDEHDFTWVVNAAPAPITISGSGPAAGTVGTPANFTFSASGGNGSQMTWTVVSGNLPAGLTGAVATGNSFTVSGTPAAAGSFTFRLRAEDAAGNFGEHDFTWVINPVTPTPPGNGGAATAGGGGGGCSADAASYGWMLLLPLLAAAMRRRKARG